MSLTLATTAIGPAVGAAPPPTCGEPAASGDSLVVRCNYTGSEQSFTVPSGVTSLQVVAVGGTGQSNQHLRGGRGAVVTADIPVVPGTTLSIVVGGNGVGPGMGFNGGGPGGSSSIPGRRGGGASDVRTCTLQPSMSDTCDTATYGTSSDPRLVVAGGGGGQGEDVARGGDGGTPIGGAGEAATSGAQGGGGGTHANGGSGGATAPISGLLAVQESGHPGVAGAGGSGGQGLAGGGGGGGGFFGGGGGGSGNGRFNGGGILSGGGGGGSSYAASSATGVSYDIDTTGTPSVTITYTPATTTPFGPAVVQGSIWYSDGTKSKSGPVGTQIQAYAVNVSQDVPYKLVLGTGAPDRACQTVVQVLNPTPVFAGPSGLIGRVAGTVQPGLAPGSYKLCFEDSSAGNFTGTGGATFTVTG